MSIVPMQKINLIAHITQRDKIINFLESQEIIQIINLREKASFFDFLQEVSKNKNEEKTSVQLEQIKYAIEFLSQFVWEKKNFLTDIIQTKPRIKESDFKQRWLAIDFLKIVNQITQLEKEMAKIKDQLEALGSERELLLPWQHLDVLMSELKEVSKVKICLGTLAQRLVDKFIQEAKTFSFLDFEVVDKARSLSYLFVVYLNEKETELSQLLSKYNFKPHFLPTFSLTPAERLAILNKGINEINEQYKNICQGLRIMAQKHFMDLKLVYDYLHNQQTKNASLKNLLESKTSFLLEGWIKKKDLSTLKKGLNQISSEFELMPIEPLAEERPPVVIENISIFQPFELLTKIYSLPQEKEIDPTPFLSLFFVIFFGFCLGDAGYGILLTIISYLGWRKLKLPETGQSLLKLLLFGGLSSIVVGCLTGSWFGLVLENLPSYLAPVKFFLLSIKIADPIKNSLNLLLFSLFLGFVQIIFGLTVGLLSKFKRGEYFSGIVDYGFWSYFLLSLVFWGLTTNKIIFPHLNLLAFWLMIIGALLLVFTQGRVHKNPLRKLSSGLVSLYRVSGYLGDVLSYSRLFALGLTSSVIAMVVNILAGLTISIPFLGYIFMVMIFLGGHTFNLVISVLSAFIHSTRLQLVEFFTKFYEGGGKAFKPFRRETIYLEVVKELKKS